MEEQKVQQIRSEKNISFIDARKLALGQSSSTPNMSTVVLSGMRPSTSVSSRSVEVQTELTWPRGTKQPTQVACVTKHQTAAKSTATENVGATTAPEDKGTKGGQSKSIHPQDLTGPLRLRHSQSRIPIGMPFWHRLNERKGSHQARSLSNGRAYTVEHSWPAGQ